MSPRKWGYDSALAKMRNVSRDWQDKKDEFEDFVKMTAEKYDFANALTDLSYKIQKKT